MRRLQPIIWNLIIRLRSSVAVHGTAASLMSLQSPPSVLPLVQTDVSVFSTRAAQALAVKIADGADEERRLQNTRPSWHSASWNLSLHNRRLWWPAHTGWAVDVLTRSSTHSSRCWLCLCYGVFFFFFYHYDRKLLENTEIQVHRRVKLIKQNWFHAKLFVKHKPFLVEGPLYWQI